MKTTLNTKEEVGLVVNNLPIDAAAKLKLQADLLDIIERIPGPCTEAEHDILRRENRGSWFQRTWRPIVMLLFAAILLIGIFIDVSYLSSDSEFWEVFKIGLGGYALGRGLESITGTFSGKLRKSKEAKAVTTGLHTPKQRQQLILKLVAENPTLTVNEMAELCGVDVNMTKRDIEVLKKENKLQRIGSSKSGSWKLGNP